MPTKKIEKVAETDSKVSEEFKVLLLDQQNANKRIEKLEKMLDNQPENEEIKPTEHQDPLDHITSCPNCAENLKKKYAERQKSRVVCDNCDSKVLESEKFCYNCGEKLDEEED